MGVSVGTEAFQWQSVAEVIRGYSAKILGPLVPVGEAQARFQIIYRNKVAGVREKLGKYIELQYNGARLLGAPKRQLRTIGSETGVTLGIRVLYSAKCSDAITTTYHKTVLRPLRLERRFSRLFPEHIPVSSTVHHNGSTLITY